MKRQWLRNCGVFGVCLAAYLATMPFSATVRADDTGLVSPTVGQEVNNVGNPNNAFSSTSCGTTAATDFARFGPLGSLQESILDARADYSGFDFSSIPAGSTIDGIEVRLDGLVAATSVPLPNTYPFEVFLSTDGGTTWTPAEQTSPWTTDCADYTVGGSTFLWSRAWNTDDLDNLIVRLRFFRSDNPTQPAARIGRLDRVAVQVTYTSYRHNLAFSECLEFQRE